VSVWAQVFLITGLVGLVFAVSHLGMQMKRLADTLDRYMQVIWSIKPVVKP
jgi:uncharacterized membrane protein YhaH (DUF805 family)